MRSKVIIRHIQSMVDDFELQTNQNPSFDGSQLIYVTEAQYEALKEAIRKVQSNHSVTDIIPDILIFLLFLVLAIYTVARGR